MTFEANLYLANFHRGFAKFYIATIAREQVFRFFLQFLSRPDMRGFNNYTLVQCLRNAYLLSVALGLLMDVSTLFSSPFKIFYWRGTVPRVR